MRVVIADDHPLMRCGLAGTIDALPGFEVVAEAEDGLAALDAIREHRPAIVVVDVAMPRLDGLEVLAQAMTWADPPRFIVLTMHEDLVARAVATGALGYLLKEDTTSEIEPCLRAVAEGRRYLSRRLPPGALEAESPSAATLRALSSSERRVLRLVGRHMTSREIAGVLKVSHRTVQNHRANMVKKLELGGSAALLRFALANLKELERDI
ncbi:response regulator transcription factor [Hyphomicrobium sp.]|uniref:response regulator n=1 Tax=Hyphomicrobium sp. TaxID=82 RepID=UPI0025BD7FC0|nr:response regulator transcription factor [Hyphomicrobium sp.]MCC7252939.1 response regulator transcription factor [Hyphomicrobium sp.]